MTNSWMNEDGEPIMDGAAWRFEQVLDSEAAEERAWLAWEDDRWSDYEPECEDEHACDSCEGPGGGLGWTCSYCERPCPEGAHE